MSKKLLILPLLLVGMLFSPLQASAHVLISDETKSIGTVLHVIPDDDPVAGQTANLFFDVQTGNINNAKLWITNTATGKTDTVPIKIDKNSVTADYTFPAQGAYTLILTVISDKAYTFTYAQRVSRGVTDNALDKPTYPLASAALVFCATSTLLLIILFINHRKGIKKYSTF